MTNDKNTMCDNGSEKSIHRCEANSQFGIYLWREVEKYRKSMRYLNAALGDCSHEIGSREINENMVICNKRIYIVWKIIECMRLDTSLNFKCRVSDVSEKRIMGMSLDQFDELELNQIKRILKEKKQQSQMVKKLSTLESELSSNNYDNNNVSKKKYTVIIETKNYEK